MVESADVAQYLADNDVLRQALGITAASEGAGNIEERLDVRMSARGEYNQNFVFRHPDSAHKLLFRMNLGSQMHLEDQIGYEARALQLLQSSGRTPRLLFVDGSKSFHGYGVLVESFLPGRPLRYETDLAAAARILADIHSVPVPKKHGLVVPENPHKNIVDECEVMFSEYRSWAGADRRIVTLVDGWFEQAWDRVNHVAVMAAAHPEVWAVRRHIINTEVNSGNFLINDGFGGAVSGFDQECDYLVDWEKPLVAEVEQDLGHFLVATTTFWKTDVILGTRDIEGFIDHYRRAVAGRFETEHLEKRLKNYMAIICLRGFTWCAMALAQHLSGKRRVADAYTLTKIKTYLSEDFRMLLDRSYYGA